MGKRCLLSVWDIWERFLDSYVIAFSFFSLFPVGSSTIGKDGKRGWGICHRLSMGGSFMQGSWPRERELRVHYCHRGSVLGEEDKGRQEILLAFVVCGPGGAHSAGG